jgi:hypothetical protein
MYNEGKDSGDNDGYDPGLLESHNNGWDEAKEYYQKIFENELKEAKQQWRKEKEDNEYSEEDMEEYEKQEVEDEWSTYGQNLEWKQTKERDWFEY